MHTPRFFQKSSDTIFFTHRPSKFEEKHLCILLIYVQNIHWHKLVTVESFASDLIC